MTAGWCFAALGLEKGALEVVQAPFCVLQSSALRSRSQRAVWQALHSHLKLLQSLNSLALQPQTVSELVMAASEDAAAAANDVLPPLLNSLRFASDSPDKLCACVYTQLLPGQPVFV